ncbi:hypothetical protein A0H81_08384 [Grifola frondosa]|uniref:Uncharacterized protein n=1 Tax=Grifola frondosa TaxID=5627 RepID=A0A1C7M3G1_GRIFR|nr:hypothetical protein A0H81_08384 [Grifola frondosa]
MFSVGRLPRLQPHFSVTRRFASNQPQSWVPEDPPRADFRPPWVYRAIRIANFVAIPSAILYSVFFADFGDHEHVFSPARRWMDAQRAAFFSLSPAERRVAGANENPSEDITNSSGTQQG